MGSIPIVGSVYSFAIVAENFDHNLQRVNASALWNKLDGYPSGQRGLTVNQLAGAFGGSNPSPSIKPDREIGLARLPS